MGISTGHVCFLTLQFRAVLKGTEHGTASQQRTHGFKVVKVRNGERQAWWVLGFGATINQHLYANMRATMASLQEKETKNLVPTS